MIGVADVTVALGGQPILHGIILRIRPKRSAEAYNQIWTNEGSPLRAIAHRQAEALRSRLPDVSVHYAMRYGHPGIAAALEVMVAEGCARILAAPLYPQYCAATTATANDAVFGALARMRWQFATRCAFVRSMCGAKSRPAAGPATPWRAGCSAGPARHRKRPPSRLPVMRLSVMLRHSIGRSVYLPRWPRSVCGAVTSSLSSCRAHPNSS